MTEIAAWPDGPALSDRLSRTSVGRKAIIVEAGLKRGKSLVMQLVSPDGGTEETSAEGARGRQCFGGCYLLFSSGFGLIPFLRGLADAFGWSYCLAIIAQYGINQGAGTSMLALAAKFYAFSSLGITSASWGRLNGFASIPWQLKAIFGLISDTVAIRGLHRSPYLLFAGSMGIIGTLMLTVLPVSALNGLVLAVLLLLTNLNVAIGDVVVDATVAVRCKMAPSQAAQLQSLSWGSFGLFGALSVALAGYLIEYASPQLPFAIATLCSSTILLPASLGWLERRHRPAWPMVRCVARKLCSHSTGRIVLLAALVVGIYSIALGVVQIVLGSTQPMAVAVTTVVGNFGLCALLYSILRWVDTTMAKAILFAFLRGAIVPSTEIIFEWAHDPVGGDLRCLSESECEALLALPVTNSSKMLRHHDEMPPLPPLGAGQTDGLPCGWARARGMPCLPPVLFSWSYVAGMLTIVGGTVLYSSVFVSWRFRSILAAAHALLALAGLIDLLFVTRANVGWMPDWVLFLFGDAVFVGLVDRLGDMAFFIFSAKLCPPSVEGSMFALQMGLSNFGNHAGLYLGTAVLEMFYPQLQAPDYSGLASYITLRSALRALPILLVPVLVPRGRPNDSSKDIGAGAAIVDDPEEEGGADDETGGDGDNGGEDNVGAKPSIELAKKAEITEPEKEELGLMRVNVGLPVDDGDATTSASTKNSTGAVVQLEVCSV